MTPAEVATQLRTLLSSTAPKRTPAQHEEVDQLCETLISFTFSYVLASHGFPLLDGSEQWRLRVTDRRFP